MIVPMATLDQQPCATRIAEMATTSLEESVIQDVVKDIKTLELYAAVDGRFMPKNHSYLVV